MDKKLQRQIYNLCDPSEPLRPDDERFVDLDEGGARGPNLVKKLETEIELSGQPVYQVVSGLPGSGMTTLLLQLAKRLAAKNRAHLLPVFIDAREVLDLTSSVDETDLLLAILNRAEKEVLVAERKDAEDAGKEGYFRRYLAFPTEYAENLSRLVLEMRADPSLRESIRNKISANQTNFIREVRNELVVLNDRSRKAGHEGLVVIVDSLPRLRGLSTTWREVMASAERLFARGSLRLPVHAVYTAPLPAVLHRVPGLHLLPSLRIRDREGRTDSGVDNLFRLILRRIGKAGLDAVFGEDAGARSDQLISQSAGCPRGLLQLLQNAVLAAPLSDRTLRRILVEYGEQYRRVVPSAAAGWLAHVARTGDLRRDDERDRDSAVGLMDVLLLYIDEDGTSWFSPHPAVLELPSVQEALS